MTKYFIAILFMLVLLQNCDFKVDIGKKLVYDGFMCKIINGGNNEKFSVPYNFLQHPR